jgi:hypothetical protein
MDTISHCIQTIDIILSPIFRSWDRKAYMDFTYPHFIEAYKLISPWPKEKGGLLASVKPFQTAVND